MNIVNIDCNSLPLILNTPPNGPNYVEIPTKKKNMVSKGVFNIRGVGLNGVVMIYCSLKW